MYLARSRGVQHWIQGAVHECSQTITLLRVSTGKELRSSWHGRSTFLVRYNRLCCTVCHLAVCTPVEMRRVDDIVLCCHVRHLHVAHQVIRCPGAVSGMRIGRKHRRTCTSHVLVSRTISVSFWSTAPISALASTPRTSRRPRGMSSPTRRQATRRR